MMTLDEMETSFDQAQEAAKKLAIARAGMDKLTAMGENVSMKDLVKLGGKLVAAGLESLAVASMLADAPQENPKLLAEWIQKQDIDLHQREAQLKLQTRDLRFHMGLAGMGLISQGLASQGGGLAPGGAPQDEAPAPTQTNPLMPQAGGPNG
jgi:hypothetical protein